MKKIKISCIFMTLAMLISTTAIASNGKLGYVSDTEFSVFDLSYEEYMDNTEKSNEGIFRLQESFKIESDEDKYPDYFAGTSYDYYGNLIVYVTYINDEIEKELHDIIEIDFEIVVVEHSFNELWQMNNEISGSDNIQFNQMYINIENNRLDIYFDDNEYQQEASKNIEKIEKGDDPVDISFHLAEKDGSVDLSLLDMVSDIHDFSEDEIGKYDETIVLPYDEVVSNAVTVVVYPGVGYSVTSGGDIVGTIASVVYYDGGYCLVTHGHDLVAGRKIFIGPYEVGYVQRLWYSSSFYGQDAALIRVTASISPSTIIKNTSRRIQGAFSNSQLASMGKISGAYAGTTATTQMYAVKSTTILYTTSGSGNASTLSYLTLSAQPAKGYSGGPIFAYSGSYTYIAGIAKGVYGSVGVGVTAQNLKSGLYFSYWLT